MSHSSFFLLLLLPVTYDSDIWRCQSELQNRLKKNCFVLWNCAVPKKQIVLCCVFVPSQNHNLWNCENTKTQFVNLWKFLFCEKKFYAHASYSLFMNKTGVKLGKKSAFWFPTLKQEKIFGYWTKNLDFNRFW